jgi:hypothetical protein
MTHTTDKKKERGTTMSTNSQRQPPIGFDDDTVGRNHRGRVEKNKGGSPLLLSLSLSRPIAHTSPGGFCGMQIFVVIIFDIISNGAKKIKFRMELLYMYILD